VPELTNRAKKDIDKLPAALQTKVHALIGRLDAEPALGAKLLGKLKGYRSVRLGRSHRMIYSVPPEGTPIVMTVIPRRDAYR
jgi:mRNA-degrading endonuclease RelE of RelBE toxin-antitoxin system